MYAIRITTASHFDYTEFDNRIKAAFGPPHSKRYMDDPRDTGFMYWDDIRNTFDATSDTYTALTDEAELWLMLNTPPGAEVLEAGEAHVSD